MESNRPFEYQLFLLKLIGYQFSYDDGWRGLVLQCWGYCIWICLGIGAVTGIHCVLTNLNSVIIFTEASAYTASLIMCFIRVSVFFTQRWRIKKLYEELMSVTENGWKSWNFLNDLFLISPYFSFWSQPECRQINQQIQLENEPNGRHRTHDLHV